METIKRVSYFFNSFKLFSDLFFDFAIISYRIFFNAGSINNTVNAVRQNLRFLDLFHHTVSFTMPYVTACVIFIALFLPLCVHSPFLYDYLEDKNCSVCISITYLVVINNL